VIRHEACRRPAWHGEIMEGQPVGPLRVLVADDDDEMRKMLATLLRRQGFEVQSASDGQEVADRLAADGEPPDVLITDMRMPGISGLRLIQWVLERFPGTQIILITAFGDRRTHARAAELGAAAVFDKPFDFNDLLQAVHQVAGA